MYLNLNYIDGGDDNLRPQKSLKESSIMMSSPVDIIVQSFKEIQVVYSGVTGQESVLKRVR